MIPYLRGFCSLIIVDSTLDIRQGFLNVTVVKSIISSQPEACPPIPRSVAQVALFLILLSQFVFVSSCGILRKDKPPFSLLNAFGVLDAKQKGEEAIIRSGLPYTITAISDSIYFN